MGVVDFVKDHALKKERSVWRMSKAENLEIYNQIFSNHVNAFT